MICSNCGFENPPDNRFCGKCGSIISKSCSACGAANPLTFKYCGKCGTAFTGGVNRFGREEPSATYSYFPSSGTAFEVKSPKDDQDVQPESIRMLKGERRVATVIVADVKKSTDLLSVIGSEVWVELMSKLLQVLEAQVYRFGGKVDQFRGDGLIAFFGARDAHEDDPERAVLAALAMQEGFERYKKEFSPVNSEELKLRIGINTDELIVAQVGVMGLHQENTAMGEAIALAARLEAMAEPGTVLVSEATYHQVAGKFHWIDLGEISLKGITDPVQVYRPLAVRSDVELLRDARNYFHSSPLIGRYDEYNLLRQKVDQVLEGRGEIMLISGERGLGKTFLIRQVLQELVLRKQVYESYEEVFRQKQETGSPDRQKILTLQGWCNSYEQPTPFFMWQILIKSWLGIDPEDSEEQVLDRLTAYCQDLWHERYNDFLPMFASILSLPGDEFGEKLASLDAQGYQGKLFQTMRSWLRMLSERVPLIIYLGSTQWANAGSIDLLREVISLSEDHPILWFVLYRPDRLTPIWQFQHFIATEYPHRMTQITIEPFDKEESQALIEYLLQPNKLDHETLDVIVNRTEGNPYFIRELVNSLVNDGVLEKDEKSKTWQLTDTITVSDLPENLQSLFLSRIDKLSQPDRLILQIASVVGFEFWKIIIDELAPKDIDVTESLNNLQKAGLIEERGSALELGIAYQFLSTLIKDVTYESILTSERKALHAKIGTLLQDFESNPVISTHFLAYHFQMAEDLNLELFYRIEAATKAKDVFAIVEAYQEYSRALEILDILEQRSQTSATQSMLTQRFELVKGRAELLYHLGRVVEANEESRRLMKIADQLNDDPIWRIDALLMQPGVNFISNQEMLQEGIPQAQEALRLSQEIGDQYREMQSLAAIAGHNFYQNDPNWKEVGEQAIAIAEELGDKKTQVELLLGLAGGYGLDKLEDGLEMVKIAQPIAEEIDYKAAQIELLYWLGTEFERKGDYYTLLKDYEEQQLRISQELGWRLVEARSSMFVGQIMGIYLGDYQNALPFLHRAEELWRDTDQRLFVYLRKAQVYSYLKDFKKARKYLDLAQPLSAGFVQSLARVGSDLVNAIMNLEIGNLNALMRVMEYTDRVLQIVEEENLVSRQYRMTAGSKAAQAQLGIAKIFKESNDISGYDHYRHLAIDSSGLALDTYNDFGFTQIVECVSEEILYTHGLALRENDQLEEGEKYINKAYSEVMRKFKLIPEGSKYRKTFMEIELHRQILDERKRFQ